MPLSRLVVLERQRYKLFSLNDTGFSFFKSVVFAFFDGCRAVNICPLIAMLSHFAGLETAAGAPFGAPAVSEEISVG